MDEIKAKKYAAMQHEFNTCIGQTGRFQLYHDFHLWYKVRDNYWSCIDKECGCRLSTEGDPANPNGLIHPNLPLPSHTCEREQNFDPNTQTLKYSYYFFSLFFLLTFVVITPEDFMIRRHWRVLTDRIKAEIHTWPSILFDEEIKLLQTVHGVSVEAIAKYVKPYVHYKSG